MKIYLKAEFKSLGNFHSMNHIYFIYHVLTLKLVGLIAKIIKPKKKGIGKIYILMMSLYRKLKRVNETKLSQHKISFTFNEMLWRAGAEGWCWRWTHFHVSFFVARRDRKKETIKMVVRSVITSNFRHLQALGDFPFSPAYFPCP